MKNKNKQVDIIGTNLLTKFHKDRKINVASRENAPPPGSHVFQPTGIIFELVQDIIGMDLLTKFHEDRTVNVASREKCPPPPLEAIFFKQTIIFKLIQDIIKTNLLTKFHEDWTINVACRVLTRKNAPPLVAMFLKQPKPFSKSSIQDIIGTNLLTKFHDDQKINVTSRVLTRKIAPPPWWPYIIGINLLTKLMKIILYMWPLEKNAPPLGGNVFQANVTVFNSSKISLIQIF
ncbi:hypothetical protein DPMN_091577 [Dreissena polymorpha]|uniref:Uncharacterized protein n=1 Tax=Dreissena polymorpha TaxID=45954 RepID=A0A9D4QZ87_DREPO|nr:hypothetical protein DPMN_091577 [Dreissena polymorpha]